MNSLHHFAQTLHMYYTIMPQIITIYEIYQVNYKLLKCMQFVEWRR
jgi:hypothetical protein